MKRTHLTRFWAGLLAVLMLVSLLPITASAEGKTFVLDPGDLKLIVKGTKADGEALKAGTEEYFTIFLSQTAQVQGNGKDFDDGFSATKRIHYSAPSEFGDVVKNAVRIKTNGAATVKVWWGCGDVGRQVAVFRHDGTVLTQTNEPLNKNDLCISELAIEEAGTYYIGNLVGNNYQYKIEVTEVNPAPAKPPRADWAGVDAPEITDVDDDGEGSLVVSVDGLVGHDGADELIVTMFDAAGTQLGKFASVMEQDEHKISFKPEVTGKYSFTAVLRRAGEADKPAKDSESADFLYPLAQPIVASATSAGGGKVNVVWNAVKEAEKYEIFCDGASVGTTTETKFTVEGLTIDQKYAFQVAAIRGDESEKSESVQATAFAEERRAWGFTYYGPSINDESNGYIGDLNEDGKVTVYSENGRGKIVPASVDGIAFYYTAVPTTHNFTLRAKVSVDSWTFSNGQEGFGLLATDRLGVSGSSLNFWNNQYMAAATKIEYRYDADTETIYPTSGTGTRYSMKLGLGTIVKTGVTPENLPLLDANDTPTINSQFISRINSLECAAGSWGKDSGTYNIVGNYTADVEGSIENELRTEFILEIQKNNTGYFITYYDANGEIINRQKNYGPNDLSILDKDNVYVGFFAARNARITVSDVNMTTILATEDAPAEEKPVTKIEPTAVITSPTVTTSKTYPITVNANVDGTLDVLVGLDTVAEGLPVKGMVRFRHEITLPDYGEHRVQIRFNPDPEQNLGPDTVLTSTSAVSAEIMVACNKGFHHRKTLYVSPNGLPSGTGSREYPLDIYTAVNNANAGQCLVLMDGTYKMTQSLKIQRGMDGTAENPISMIADKDAHVVLDFQGQYTGIVVGASYWYFQGFDVCHSQAGQKGFQVSGHYNTLDRINTYDNGNTGIQISRYSGHDDVKDWPSNNLILNCTSYRNADPGYEDADGFAAKLTCGPGNVFDGCVAYHNADDGWDLYAKTETGSIGSVTIRNCVAYENGYAWEDGKLVEAGNGNGFKMGGESLSGKHVLENSYAFNNKSKGIDSNSCPDIIVKNCVSYNNGTYNVAFYTNNSANTDFSATGVVSFKDSTIKVAAGLGMADNLKPKGNQDESKFRGSSNFYWSGAANAITADMFTSLTFNADGVIARNADGTINMQGFLEMNDKAPAGVGATMGGQASAVIALPTDLEHTYSQEWNTADAIYHFHECECGDRADYGEHTLVWVVDKEPTKEAEGLKHQECSVCGHKKPSVSMYFGEVIEGYNDGSGMWWIAIPVVLALAGAGAWLLLRNKKKSA